MSDELQIPASDDHAKRLAQLTALAHGSTLNICRDAIGLAYALGRNIGRLEGAESTARAWGESIEKTFPQASGASASGEPK